MSARKAGRPRETQTSAVVIAFPIVTRREPNAAAKLPFALVPRRSSEHVKSRAAPKAANENDRPTLPASRRGWWWETAIALSVCAHGALSCALWERNGYDLERAAGAAAASNDGAMVIPVEVLVNAALPSARAPVEATAPEETKVTQAAPREEQEAEKEEKTESAPPQKSEDAAEVTKAAAETPKPEKKRERQKKKSSASHRTAAADPSQAAASASHGRAGAGGRLQSGGSANVSSYQARVLAHLQRYKSYPDAARSGGIRGVATVRFSLSASGSVISASLAHGSGASVLDQAAVAMVRRASPFPPVPPELGSSRMDFVAPIRFDLH